MTVPVTARVLLRGQLSYLREQGFDVTVVSSPGPDLDLVAERERVAVIGVPIEREIAIGADSRSLRGVTAALHRLDPDIVNASTAKGGLIGLMAAAATRVPVRIYQLRGLRLETETGLKRRILGLTEHVASRCAHRVVCNSESLRATYVAEGYAPDAKCVVLGAGSSNGIEVERFARERWIGDARALRAQLGIPVEAPVVGFVGRPVADKGIAELLDAMEIVRVRVPAAHLVLVGAGFADDHVPASIASRLQQSHVHLIPRVDEPAPYYAMMDLLAFPSYREGFPNAPLEAAAAGLPTVGFRVTGVRDAVVDGETGALVATHDARSLADALQSYLLDTPLRHAHGEAARHRAVTRYGRAVVWEQWRDEYVRLLRARGLPLPVPS